MTPTTTVSASAVPAAAATPTAGAPPATTGATPAAATPSVDATELQRQIDELKGQVAERDRAAQYWADRAHSSGQAAAPAAAAEEEPDILEAITTKGAKGLDEVLKKRGYVREADVDAKVNERAAALTTEQELMTQYPDLKKKDSEFFKATAVHYGALVKDGVPQAKAMSLAAEKAELEFIRSGKLKLPGSEPTKEEKEAERLRRVRAQGGEGTRGRPAADAEPEDEELTAEQKHIADAMGISHEAYAKRAKTGVSIKGGLGR